MHDYAKHRAWLKAKNLKSYSQFGEDLRIEQILIDHLGSPPRKGIFLELGAVNGIVHSNTLHFAENYEWKGFLIEPSPIAFAQLSINRPESLNFNYAIHPTENEVLFYGHNSLGVVAEKATSEYLERWHQDQKSYSVPAIPISRIINARNAPIIDFFSLDVEGSEYNVLSTFDWSIKLGLICVELSGDFVDSRRDQCRQILKENGYDYLEKFHINEIYINRDNLLSRFKTNRDW